MKDRADYARKGIARGRSLVAFSVSDGIVLVAENAFRTLYKICEIYDRIAFAGVGKYNEFEMLRVAGVRQADLKGYSFAREDVNARALANAYGQTLGQVFTHEMKPYEVEILVAQVGETRRRRRAVPHPLRRHRHGRRGQHRARRSGRGDRHRDGVALLHRDGLRGRHPARRVGARRARHRALRRPARSRAARPHPRPPRRSAGSTVELEASSPSSSGVASGSATSGAARPPARRPRTTRSRIAATHRIQGRRRGGRSVPASHHSVGAAMLASTSSARST